MEMMMMIVEISFAHQMTPSAPQCKIRRRIPHRVMAQVHLTLLYNIMLALSIIIVDYDAPRKDRGMWMCER